ncbi:CHC2 zinc finger domain-containing protein [Caldanaerobacter subterraneus]|uniref:AAA family ATPase n=1 Tax=Caldanaerobacter subterraneus TaxID=911092 RepID=A0A7Y2PMV8_9THEO|nr:CHC2 zinc finger domain-containing protein [Caldanaerobacter subterraneus]NNG68110.1 AAA family ATPase [Caldanaerobacter subterraneus]
MDIATLKKKVDIVNIISHYVELKREGTSYKGLCPFHPDTNPSFSVSPERQIYKCFGCGVGGDVFDFVQRIENCTFDEAVKKVMEMAGINEPLPIGKEEPLPIGKTAEEHKEDFSKFVEEAHKNISKTDYLSKRGISEALIKKYCIGFDGEGVIVPLSYRGEIVGYVKRFIEGERRYYNPKGVKLVPFNIDVKQDIVFVTEGIFDALAIEEAIGLPAIALLGSQNHNVLLDNLHCNHYIIMLDNDETGQKQALELYNKLKEKKKKVILFDSSLYPAEIKDPNEWLIYDRDIFKKVLDLHVTKVKKPYSLKALALNYQNTFREGKYKPIPTGIKAIDDALEGGLRKGMFYTIGAMPGTGKSSLCIQITDSLAKAGYNVIYVSVEMSEYEIQTKLFAREFTLKRIEQGFLEKKDVLIQTELLKGHIADRDKVVAFNEIIKDYIDKVGEKIHIVYTTSLDEIRQAVATEPNSILIVDYLQKIQPNGRFQTDKQRIDAVLNELNKIKNEFGIPVLLISSINRQSYNSESEMSAFKESGTIEYDTAAAFVMTTKKDENKKDLIGEDEVKGVYKHVYLECLKNRYGQTGTRKELVFYPLFSHFEEKEGGIGDDLFN